MTELTAERKLPKANAHQQKKAARPDTLLEVETLRARRHSIRSATGQPINLMMCKPLIARRQAGAKAAPLQAADRKLH